VTALTAHHLSVCLVASYNHIRAVSEWFSLSGPLSRDSCFVLHGLVTPGRSPTSSVYREDWRCVWCDRPSLSTHVCHVSCLLWVTCGSYFKYVSRYNGIISLPAIVRMTCFKSPITVSILVQTLGCRGVGSTAFRSVLFLAFLTAALDWWTVLLVSYQFTVWSVVFCLSCGLELTTCIGWRCSMWNCNRIGCRSPIFYDRAGRRWVISPGPCDAFRASRRPIRQIVR